MCNLVPKSAYIRMSKSNIIVCTYTVILDL
jgi:hypothetical protein